ncbi:amino acid ABC transporter permease [Helicobacter sp. 12S02634-8]|uniref:amino acid ABC transporter permease n=1 Tax=Helicobacter sp. 12S02634-8 TaxID=1476199 RepID=UPI000BA596C4|nr:amino acid ABC transporter permease [Helicobacter sp. 12S02634-8]PAF48351.1 amino acid ABC transporter permease [Helicobacter sp. 12S02634-8]
MMEGLFVFAPNNLMRLLEGLGITLYIAIISILIALIGGGVMGLIMAFGAWWARLICRFYLECIRIIPILAWLFIVYFGLSSFLGIHMSGQVASIVVFSLWGIAEMGDLVRGALSSVSTHQIQSAKALGLNGLFIAIFIIFPQAIPRLLPASINLFTRIIKTTSLVALIGVVDLLKVGQQIIELNILSIPQASFWVYGVIFIIYFLLCYPLSVLSAKLELKYHD